MEEAKRVARRKHDAELKARVVAECTAPDASVARVALEHGLNANLVHRWLRIAQGRERGRQAVQRVEQFIAVPMATAAVASPPAGLAAVRFWASIRASGLPTMLLRPTITTSFPAGSMPLRVRS